MVNRDYRKEVGVASSKKTVPKALAIVVLVAVAGVVTWSATQVVEASKKHHAKSSAPASTAPAD